MESTTGREDIPIIAIKPPESLENFPKSFVGQPSELRARVEVSVICINKVAANFMATVTKAIKCAIFVHERSREVGWEGEGGRVGGRGRRGREQREGGRTVV